MSYRKISILYDYLASFTHSFNMETRFAETVEKTEKPSYLTSSVQEDEEWVTPETESCEPQDSNIEVDAFYTKSNNKLDTQDFCKEYLVFDKRFAKKVNEDPKN